MSLLNWKSNSQNMKETLNRIMKLVSCKTGQIFRLFFLCNSGALIETEKTPLFPKESNTIWPTNCSTGIDLTKQENLLFI